MRHYCVMLLLAGTLRVMAGSTLFHSQYGFTFTLPDDWEELPEFALATFAEQLARAAPGAPRQTYEHGYQLTNAPRWFSCPYILVQIRETGRIPESALTSYHELKPAISASASNTARHYHGILSDPQLKETVYDPTQRVLWSQLSMHVGGVGTVSCLVAVKLTSRGYLQFNAYTEEASSELYMPIFVQAVNSLTLDAHLVYTPRLTDHWFLASAGGRIVRATLMGAIYGAGAALAVFVLRRLKKRPAASADAGQANTVERSELAQQQQRNE